MSNCITVENLLRTLPPVLANDDDLRAVATSIAIKLEQLPTIANKCLIYPDIDSLPEDLLDILAHDFHVDWYGYDYPVEAKRELIKGSFHVHRMLGTKGAIRKALSALYSNSSVSEWFEYNGTPFYFRIIVDVTDQFFEISHGEIVKTVNIYKSMRSHLEDDSIAYRTSCRVCAWTRSGSVLYNVRRCGTYPVVSMQGSIEDGGLSVATGNSGCAPYRVRVCGTENGCLM